MPSGHAPLPSRVGPKISRCATSPRSSILQPGDAAAGRLDDVEELFVCVEPDFVREPEAVGHDPERAVLVARQVAVRQIGAKRVHPVLDAGGDRDPDAVARITKDEVHLADRLAVDPVRQHARRAVARHDLEAVGAEIRDQKVAVAIEGEPVRQRALEVARGLGAGGLEVSRPLLRDDLLRSVRTQPDDAAARVRRPERPVPLGEDALGALQIVADVTQSAFVDAEVED